MAVATAGAQQNQRESLATHTEPETLITRRFFYRLVPREIRTTSVSELDLRKRQGYLGRLGSVDPDSFPGRIRKLVAQGFKPKNAVDILLQEVALEHHGEEKILEHARIDGEDFLRHMREGLVRNPS